MENARTGLPSDKDAARWNIAAGVDMVLPIEERWYQVEVVERGGRWQAIGPIKAGITVHAPSRPWSRVRHGI